MFYIVSDQFYSEKVITWFSIFFLNYMSEIISFELHTDSFQGTITSESSYKHEIHVSSLRAFRLNTDFILVIIEGV